MYQAYSILGNTMVANCHLNEFALQVNNRFTDLSFALGTVTNVIAQLVMSYFFPSTTALNLALAGLGTNLSTFSMTGIGKFTTNLFGQLFNYVPPGKQVRPFIPHLPPVDGAPTI